MAQKKVKIVGSGTAAMFWAAQNISTDRRDDASTLEDVVDLLPKLIQEDILLVKEAKRLMEERKDQIV